MKNSFNLQIAVALLPPVTKMNGFQLRKLYKKIPLDRTADVEQASSEVIVARSPLPAEKGMG